jgi:hypothetical protein
MRSSKKKCIVCKRTKSYYNFEILEIKNDKAIRSDICHSCVKIRDDLYGRD